jgi:hypothetical protein
VKAHHLDNLYSRRGSTEEHFKLFIGFKVSVCTNLCVWSEGYAGEIKVKNLEQLRQAIHMLISSYDAITGHKNLSELQNYSLIECQFAHLLGRYKMYGYLPSDQKKDIQELKFGESQLSSICRDYYRDHSFCRDEKGDINLWRRLNLFTAANKSSYIDAFLDSGVNAAHFVQELKKVLNGGGQSWFLP